MGMLWLRFAGYPVILVWINVYIAREMFFVEHTGHMNSMHGFWIALGRLAEHQWWRPGWWPAWDAGMPFEFTYAPLIPALSAIGSKLTGVSVSRSFHSIMGVFYVLTPVTMYLAAAILTRSPGWSFVAALLYSVTSTTQFLAPDEPFAWTRLGDARRLYLTAVWDELPHLAALTALPLVVLFVRLRFWIAAGACMCVMLLANAFGLTALLITMLCLLAATGWEQIGRVASTLGCAYLICCPFLPPSLFFAISRNQQFHGSVVYGPGSFTAVGLVLLGCVLIWLACVRFRAGWWFQFVALLTWIMLAIPLISVHLGRTFLPQSVRYKMEAELGLCLLLAYALRSGIERWPMSIRVSLALLGLSIAAEQVVSHRKFAKTILKPVDPAVNIEYKAARWAAENLPGARVWYPGALGQWLNACSESPQMMGSSWSTAYNAVHQRIGYQLLYSSQPQDAENAMHWLRAYGVQAFAIAGKRSPEFWKPIGHPELFEGCEVLWREEDTKICSVPGASGPIAHVLSRDALVHAEPRDWRDASGVRRFTAALDKPAAWQWEGTDSALIRANASAGEAIHIQVTHHPGWRATQTGNSVPIHRDGLGMMWIESPCSGPCDIKLSYDGGWELKLCRWISILTIATILIWSKGRPHRIDTNSRPDLQT